MVPGCCCLLLLFLFVLVAWWCSLWVVHCGGALWVVHCGWCTVGGALWVVHCGWCTVGGALWVVHCGWCTVGGALLVCLLVVPVGGACWWCLLVVVVCVCVVGVFKIFGPLPRTLPLRRTVLPLDRPNFRSFFSLSRRKFLSFFSLWEVFSLNFGGVFEDRNAQMCTFGLSGCRVESRWPHQTGPPGLHTTTRELQTRTFERPGASNTTKIPRENPQREKKE